MGMLLLRNRMECAALGSGTIVPQREPRPGSRIQGSGPCKRTWRQRGERAIDLPAGASGPCDGGHVVGPDLQAGEERVRVGALAVALDGELDPGPQDGVVAVADRQPVHPAEAVPLDLLVAVAGLDPAAGMHEVVVQQFV